MEKKGIFYILVSLFLVFMVSSIWEDLRLRANKEAEPIERMIVIKELMSLDSWESLKEVDNGLEWICMMSDVKDFRDRAQKIRLRVGELQKRLISKNSRPVTIGERVRVVSEYVRLWQEVGRAHKIFPEIQKNMPKTEGRRA